MLVVGERICEVGKCPHGCQPFTGCEGHAWRLLAPDYYEREIQSLLERAVRDGVSAHALISKWVASQ